MSLLDYLHTPILHGIIHRGSKFRLDADDTSIKQSLN